MTPTATGTDKVAVIPKVMAVAEGVMVTVGNGLISTEEPDGKEEQPVVEFLTTRVPLYVPFTLAGTFVTVNVPAAAVRLILAKVGFTLTKPAAVAAASQIILYWSGELLVV